MAMIDNDSLDIKDTKKNILHEIIEYIILNNFVTKINNNHQKILCDR